MLTVMCVFTMVSLRARNELSVFIACLYSYVCTVYLIELYSLLCTDSFQNKSNDILYLCIYIGKLLI